MEVQWDQYEKGDIIYIKEKMSNGQTFYMELSLYDYNSDTNFWNICIEVYSKRKHFDDNMNHKNITSKAPMESVKLALKAFPLLEAECIECFRDFNNVIFCTWLDTRRRDIYYKYLKKRGYDFGTLDNFKCIMKKFEKKNI